MAKKSLTMAEVAKRRLSDDGKPEPGTYFPRGARYSHRQWIKKGKIIGRSASEDSPFIPVNRSRIKGAK